MFFSFVFSFFFFWCVLCTSLWSSSVAATVLIGRCHWRDKPSVGLFILLFFLHTKKFLWLLYQHAFYLLKTKWLAPRGSTCVFVFPPFETPGSCKPYISKPSDLIFLHLKNVFFLLLIYAHIPPNLPSFWICLYLVSGCILCSLWMVCFIIKKKEVTDKKKWL